MPTLPRTDTTDLLAAVIARLLARGVVESDAAVIVTAVAPEEVPHTIAPRDVLLWPQGEATLGNEDGAGRVATWAARKLFVVARSRLSLDKAGSDRQRLMNETLGHFALCDAVRNALHLFWPETAARDLLGVQPMRWKATAPARKDRPAPASGVGAWRSGGDTDWVYSVLEFESIYEADLDQGDQ